MRLAGIVELNPPWPSVPISLQPTTYNTRTFQERVEECWGVIPHLPPLA